MSILLADLAKETSASNRRVADRLEIEARDLDNLRHGLEALEELRQRVLESARQATDYAVSRVSEAEGIWRRTWATLRKPMADNDAERLRHVVVEILESGQRLVDSSRRLWSIAEQLGQAPEGMEHLGRAERDFKKLTAEAKLAIAQLKQNWEPADPSRLALGLQLAREGNTLKADEARARFRARRK